LSKGPGIRAGGALSGAETTDNQQGRGFGARCVLGIAAAPPPRRKALAEKREFPKRWRMARQRGPASAEGPRSAARRRRISSKDRGAVGGAPRNPRRRPRRGGKPRLKNGFPRVSADPWLNGAGIAARGAPAGGKMCTVPSRFECAILPRGPTTGSGALAMGQRGPMAGDSFQMGRFFFSGRKILKYVLKEKR